DVAREETARTLDLAAAALLDDVLGRDQHFADLVLQPVRLHALLERLPYFVFEARVRVDDVPVLRLVVGDRHHDFAYAVPSHLNTWSIACDNPRSITHR